MLYNENGLIKYRLRCCIEELNGVLYFTRTWFAPDMAQVSWAWIDRIQNKRLYQKSYDDNDDYAFFGLGRKKLQGDGAVYGPQK